MGTVADVVPLDANNRVLVDQGVRRMRAGRCVPGIKALLEIAGRSLSGLSAADLAFGAAPRLNAAGRLDDMSIGIQCLISDDAQSARALAARLDELNQERRTIEARMQQEALAAVRRLTDTGPQALERSGVCLFDESWHQGVVGLVASRVKERVRRPVIAFALADASTLRGSARSLAGLHIRDMLEAIATRHPGLVSRFGGHAMAAGLTLERAKLDAFARAFDEEAARRVRDAPPADTVETDGELASEELALATAHALRAGGPWGSVVPRAVVRRSVQHSQRPHRQRAASEDVGRAAAQRSRLRCHRLQSPRAGRTVSAAGGRGAAGVSAGCERIPGREAPAAAGGSRPARRRLTARGRLARARQPRLASGQPWKSIS